VTGARLLKVAGRGRLRVRGLLLDMPARLQPRARLLQLAGHIVGRRGPGEAVRGRVACRAPPRPASGWCVRGSSEL